MNTCPLSWIIFLVGTMFCFVPNFGYYIEQGYIIIFLMLILKPHWLISLDWCTRQDSSRRAAFFLGEYSRPTGLTLCTQEHNLFTKKLELMTFGMKPLLSATSYCSRSWKFSLTNPFW